MEMTVLMIMFFTAIPDIVMKNMTRMAMGTSPHTKPPTHPYIKQKSGSRLGELPKLASKTSLDSRTQDIAYATNCQTIKWTKQMGYKTI